MTSSAVPGSPLARALGRIRSLEAALEPFAAVPLPGDEARTSLGRPGYRGQPSEGAEYVWLSLGRLDALSGTDQEMPDLRLADFRAAREALGRCDDR